MNILIVGNGFDLAHGLPTKYADFLKFIDFFYKHKAQESSGLELIAGEDINCYKYFTDLFNSKQDSEFDQYLYDQSRKTIHELSDLCKDNAWIKYFSEVYKSREQKGKDGWIDFEGEICPDHVHLLVSIPPKISVSSFVDFPAVWKYEICLPKSRILVQGIRCRYNR